MIQAKRLFENLFDDKNITPTRLANFAGDSLNRLTAANNDGQYSTIISRISGPLEGLTAELGQVDTGVTVQKGATLTNNQVMDQFKNAMSTEEPFIARALGGKETPAYLQFYPQGISEYGDAAKTQMNTLTHRINVAAGNFSTELGTALTATLQGFEASWINSRNTQQQQMGTVENNRSGRSQARLDVELALVYAVHTVAAIFPGNVEACTALFDFTLLLPQPHRRHETFTGTLSAGQAVTVIDKTFTDSTDLTIRNTDDNAAIAVWLAPDGEETTPPAEALEIQPGRTANVKPSELGPLENPFLQVKNLSEVNEGAYEVVIS